MVAKLVKHTNIQPLWFNQTKSRKFTKKLRRILLSFIIDIVFYRARETTVYRRKQEK